MNSKIILKLFSHGVTNSKNSKKHILELVTRFVTS